MSVKLCGMTFSQLLSVIGSSDPFLIQYVVDISDATVELLGDCRHSSPYPRNVFIWHPNVGAT